MYLVYIRGKGWVYEDESIVTMRCGTKVRLQVRTPMPGERYRRTRNPEYYNNGEVSREWLEYVLSDQYRFQRTWTVDSYLEDGYIYMVTVPL